MKRRILNDIDQMILADVAEHPGTSQGGIVRRLQPKYRSRTYIQTAVQRLLVLGYLQNSQRGQQAHLFGGPAADIKGTQATLVVVSTE